MTLPLPSSPHWPPTRMMTTALLGSRLGPLRLQVVETGVVAAELELDGAGWAVAVLGYVDLGYPRLIITFVVFGPIKKHDNVRVLFDAARLAKVAEDRALVGALLGSQTQLRNGDDRYPQLASETFHGAGNR